MKNFPRQYLCLRNNRASILVAVMWILIFFSILSSALYKIVSSQIDKVRRVEDRIIGYYLVKSLLLQEQEKLQRSKILFNTLAELRQEQECSLGSGKASYYFIDEESKIDINSAPVEVMARLPGMNMDLAQNIKSSKTRPFRLKEQILFVEGIDAQVYDKIKDYITVYALSKVNINTAGPETLSALGMSDNLVKAVQKFRAGEDEAEGTGDDGTFESASIIIDKMRLAAGFSGSMETELFQLITSGVLTVLSQNLFLEAQTRFANRQGTRYEVLITKDKTKEWHEY